MASSTPFRVLRDRTYARFFFAAVISDIGTWMQIVTIGTLVAGDTGKSSATGMVMASMFAAQAIGSPLGGVLADRYDRRKMIVTMLFVQTALTSVLAAVIGAGARDPALLALLVTAQGVANSLWGPAAQAMLPELVGPEDVVPALSMASISWNTGRVLGPLLAVLCTAVADPQWVIGANAFSFAVLGVAILTIRRRFPGKGVRTRVWHELADGTRRLAAHPSCRTALVLVVLIQVSIGAFMGLVPIFARRELDGGRGLVGAMTAAQGLGAVLGAVLATVLVDLIGRAKALAMSVLVSSGVLVGYAHAPNGPAAVAIIFCLGAFMVMTYIHANAVVQRDAPVTHRGRFLSLFNALVGLTYGLGVYGQGVLGDRWDLRAVHTAAALFMGAVAIVSLVAAPALWRMANRAPTPAPAGGARRARAPEALTRL